MTNLPRILAFSLSYHPHIGGAELALQRIMHEAQGEFSFTVICGRFDPTLPEHEIIEGVEVYRVGKGTKRDKYWYPIRAFKKALSLHRFNGAWAMMENYALITAYLYYIKTGVKYLLSLQSGDSDMKLWSRVLPIYPLYRAAHRNAYRVQAISRYLAQRAKRFGVQRDVSVIANGVDLSLFKPCSESEKKETNPVIISVSRLVYKNGIDSLLRAFALLPSSYTLELLGDGPERNYLEGIADECGVRSRVVFRGSVDNTQVPTLLRHATVFVRPSRSEGFGNSFIEAMACGVPVVGTFVGGIKDFLIHETNGLVANVDDPKSIAECTRRLVEDISLRDKVIKNGLLCAERYSWSAVALEMKPLLRDICV